MSTLADTAHGLVLGDRNADYGNPHPDFAGVALMWSGLLNAKLSAHITAQEVALMMTALKLRREAHKHKDDNLADAHGYLLCLEWIVRGERPVPAVETERATAQATLETVCTGERLICTQCKKPLPCLCSHATIAAVGDTVQKVDKEQFGILTRDS